jgi:serine/threonine protein kinase
MKKRGRIPEREAVAMLKQICNGFVALIKEGVMHRDLKPENILIHQGIMKLADFGFSKKDSAKKMTAHTMVGTPMYMSIQVLKGLPYSSKCDIWSLGLIFY